MKRFLIIELSAGKDILELTTEVKAAELFAKSEGIAIELARDLFGFQSPQAVEFPGSHCKELLAANGHHFTDYRRAEFTYKKAIKPVAVG